MRSIARIWQGRGAALATGAILLVLGQTALAGEVRTIEIEATEFAFEPSRIQVEQGEKVRLKLVNQGNISHNLHLHGADVKTETIQAGNSDTVQFTANESGTVQFFCNVPGHKEAGMKGEMVVE